MGQSDVTSNPGEEPAIGARLLLAEDDPELRRMMARALRRRGYAVVEAHDGRELVEVLLRAVTGERGLMPALIVSDVRMPGHTGLEVLARLRRIDWRTPVILLTAFGDPETHAEAERLGAAALLDKPFDLDDLCSAATTLVPPR